VLPWHYISKSPANSLTRYDKVNLGAAYTYTWYLDIPPPLPQNHCNYTMLIQQLKSI